MPERDRSKYALGPGHWDVNWTHLEPYERLGVEPSSTIAEIELHYAERTRDLDLTIARTTDVAAHQRLQALRAQLTRDMVQVRAAREGPAFAATGRTSEDGAPPRFALVPALVGAVVIALLVAALAYLLL